MPRSLSIYSIRRKQTSGRHARFGSLGERKHPPPPAQLTGKLFPVLLTAWLIRQPCREEAGRLDTKRRAESKGLTGVVASQGLVKRSRDKWRKGRNAFAQGMVIGWTNSRSKKRRRKLWTSVRIRLGSDGFNTDRFRTIVFERAV